MSNSLGTALVVVDIVFPVASAILIGLRITARNENRNGLAWDDYSIILAWVNLRSWLFRYVFGNS